MRVFVTDLHTTLGSAIARHLQDADHEVLGSVPSKSLVQTAKRKLLVHPSSDREEAVKDPVATISDKVSISKLVQKAEVVVATRFAQDIKTAMDLLKLFEKAAASAGDEDDAASETVRRFVAISSVLTWSKNAPFANQKEQRGHSEDDFKTRKPAKKYVELKTAETQILSANKADVLETFVVASGLIYGGAQSSLSPLFRNAWMYPDRELLVPALPGSSSATRGENLLPMVSVYDLALLVSRIAVTSSVPKNYIVAIDRASQSTTLRDLCIGLSVLLGNGRIRDQLTEDEVETLLLSDDEEVVDSGGGLVAALQLHLTFDSTSESTAMTTIVPVEEYKHISTGLLSNLAFYVDDYIASMDLRPLKTVILGPPRVGKTFLSQRIAKEYYLPHLTLQSIAEEVLSVDTTTHQQHVDAAAEAKPEEDTTGNEVQAENDDPLLLQVRAELKAWRDTGDDSKPASVEELPETTVISLLRWKLTQAVCRNQGYVLDGLPVSAAQAGKIFELIGYGDGGDGGDDSAEANVEAKAESENAVDDVGSGDGDDNADGKAGTLSKSRSKAILDRLRPRRQIQFPNRVIVLLAPQDLLEKRAQLLSEEIAIATGNTQALFSARHQLFAAESEALILFFEQKSTAIGDGVEVLELHLESEASFTDGDVFQSPVKSYMEQGGGKPHNFHPTRDEIRQMEREYARKKQEDEVRLKQQEIEQDERDQAMHHTRLEADRARLEIIQREEAELLEARAKPLRTYLMDTVLPALTEGMLEVVKVQPDDPIDYLAEFLFKKGRDLELKASS